MNRAVLLLALSGCGHTASTQPARSGFDRQCPEDVRVTAPIPSSWKPVGVSDDGDTVYAMEDGFTTSWCAHTKAVWEVQRDAIKRDQEPSREVWNHARQKLLAGDRELQTLLEAREEERQRDAERARIDAERKAQAEQREREYAEKRAAEERERRVVTLAGLLLAERRPVDVVSVRMCQVQARIDTAREELARQKRIARETGMASARETYGAGEEIVDAQDELAGYSARLRAALRTGARGCKGALMAVALCRSRLSQNCAAHEEALRHVEGILAGSPLEQERAQAAAAMPAEEVADGEKLYSAAAAEF